MDKAQSAIHLLMDDFFMGEIDAMKESCRQRFENSRADDYEEREEAYRQLNAINAMVNHFRSIAAQKQMDSKKWKIL
jgi:hypothetical protein